MPASINQLFDQIHQLPQIPEVVRTIVKQLNDPNFHMPQIVKDVEKEQVITLKVLRLVNSAHFGLSRKVGSIEEAVTMLGTNQLKTLVIASGFVGSFPKLANFDLKLFWRTSFRTATHAGWLATQAGLQTDIAYTAGLIADLGNVLIHLGLPSEANEIDQHVKAGNSRSDIELRRLGFVTPTASAELCRRWKFPDDLTQAVEQSADPLASGTPNRLACAVFLGRFTANALEANQSSDQIIKAFPLTVAEGLGLSVDFVQSRLHEMLELGSDLDELID
ncbi:HDOD domain-containing protein [Methylomonas sp. UP202]|uniref:HDOD domain-containing protein n=1 Tax=Methylomonas sp. UP202 TaxID=3040943 RepID=UPI002479B68D|nr:HDOD domain-containing protein [Methylomonas sp. UP202]WGS87922.1 HDOD domain-containing protein [Methylomonas sp. UP202]